MVYDTRIIYHNYFHTSRQNKIKTYKNKLYTLKYMVYDTRIIYHNYFHTSRQNKIKTYNNVCFYYTDIDNSASPIIFSFMDTLLRHF